MLTEIQHDFGPICVYIFTHTQTYTELIRKFPLQDQDRPLCMHMAWTSPQVLDLPWKLLPSSIEMFVYLCYICFSLCSIFTSILYSLQIFSLTLPLV